MHQGFPCLREKLESMMLHEVVPKLLCYGFLLRWKSFTMFIHTCDGDIISEFE
jgi:hypothetical protein